MNDKQKVARTQKQTNFGSLCLTLMLGLVFAASTFGQTTEFTFQGSLRDGVGNANGSYDFIFVLFDASTGGNQVGSQIIRDNVTVTDGRFTVKLDFGSQFPGANRFMQILVRQQPNIHTQLEPRQQINSAPYSIKSLNAENATTATNATQLGGVAANLYLQTNGNGSGLTNLNAGNITTGTLNNARLGLIPTANIADSAVTAPKIAGGQVVKSLNTLKDDVTLAAGSNITITPAGNTLTIASTGGGNAILNQTTQQAGANFNISGNGTVGGTLSAGTVNSTTQFNIGGQRILSITGGVNNGNLIVGYQAGRDNTGIDNLFAGQFAGTQNTTGGSNSFVGNGAGISSTTGSNNSFFGSAAGSVNGTGSNNVFIGKAAGNQGTFEPVNNSVAIGADVKVTTSDTIVLGLVGHTTRIPGKLVVSDQVVLGNQLGVGGHFVTGSNVASFIGNGYAETFASNGISGIYTGNFILTGIDSLLASPVHACIRTTTITTIGGGSGGGQALTRCTSALSSEKNKTDVQTFTGGLNIIKSLKPVAFKWKEGGAEDIGLNAEDVAEVEPGLVTRNAKGEVEDVKEHSLNILFINAFKEQQAQIEALKKQVETLTKLVCLSNTQSKACREERE